MYSSDIDDTISEDIFKSDDEDGRRNAMLKLIELKYVRFSVNCSKLHSLEHLLKQVRHG